MKDTFIYTGPTSSIITYIPAKAAGDTTWLLYFFLAQKCKTLLRAQCQNIYLIIYLFANLCFPLEKCREEVEAVLHVSKQGSEPQTQEITAPVSVSCPLEPFSAVWCRGKHRPPYVPWAPVYANTSGLSSASIYPSKREQLVHSSISSESHAWIHGSNVSVVPIRWKDLVSLKVEFSVLGVSDVQKCHCRQVLLWPVLWVQDAPHPCWNKRGGGVSSEVWSLGSWLPGCGLTHSASSDAWM